MKKVLVIDDDPIQLDIMRCVLTEAGFNVLTASTGALGVQKALEHLPNVVLLDVMMPVMGGLEVCTSLQQHPATAGIPVIFLTCCRDGPSVVRGFSAGGIDYCTKPCDHDDLLIRLGRILNPLGQNAPYPAQSLPDSVRVAVSVQALLAASWT